MTDDAAKIGERIMWDYQLKRQLFDFSERLKTIDSQFAHQKNHSSNSEKQALSAHEERLNTIEKRIRALEHGDATERLAGLAGELRETRQDVKTLRDSQKATEKANKAVENKVKETEDAVHGRCEEFGGKLRTMQQALESRLQDASERSERHAAKALEESSRRHDGDVKALSGQLHRMEREQMTLRALVGSLKDSCHERLAAPSTTNTSALTAPAVDAPPVPKEAYRQDSKAMKSMAALPLKPEPKKVSHKKGLGNAMSREIAQLIYGDGSFTNAPAIMESQQLNVTASRGRNKRKLETDEEPLTQFAFTQRETRSQVKRVKAEPSLSTREIVGSNLAEVPKTAAFTQAPKKSATANKIAKVALRVTKPTVRKRQQPQQPSSHGIEVARSRDPSAVRDPNSENVVSKPSGDVKNTGQQSEHQSKGRRRRIQQDDTEEEFLAKCQAIIKAER